MSRSTVTNCRSCRAEIVWAIVEKSGRRMPVDRAPDPEKGNVRLLDRFTADGTPICVVLSDSELVEARFAGERLHLSHFATCPDRRSWRQTKPKRGAH